MIDFGDWPMWGRQVGWTVVTLAVSWTIGRLLASMVLSRVPRWLAGRHVTVAESAAQIVRRRPSWWFLHRGLARGRLLAALRGSPITGGTYRIHPRRRVRDVRGGRHRQSSSTWQF